MHPAFDVWSTTLLSQALPEFPSELTKERIANLVQSVCKDSLFFQRKYGSIKSSNAQISQFPIMTKNELMNNFDEIVIDKKIKLKNVKEFISKSENIGKKFLDKYYVWESSGTNGVQGIYLQDDDCINIYQALEASRKPLFSLYSQFIYQSLNLEKIAFIGALSEHYASTTSIAISKSMYPGLKKIIREFSIFDPIDKLVEKLNQYEPTIITSYPSIVLSLIQNSALNIQPREIWLGGEYLSSNQRRYIESKLKSKVYSSYGASEFLPIAWECEEENFHINSDWVYLEAVDSQYRPVSAGQLSATTLLTNLANKIQPLIRYDLGDKISFAIECCPCGSKLPHINLIGRANDTFVFNNSKKHTVTISSLALQGLIENQDIFNSMLIQNKNSELLIFFDKSAPPNHSQLSNIKQSIYQYFAENSIYDIEIKCKFKKYELNQHSGKLLRH